jgi:hypothetical protein
MLKIKQTKFVMSKKIKQMIFTYHCIIYINVIKPPQERLIRYKTCKRFIQNAKHVCEESLEHPQYFYHNITSESCSRHHCDKDSS